MITKEEAKKLLLIDEYKLEKECKIQPSIYQEIAEQHSKAVSERDFLKNQMDTLWAMTFKTIKLGNNKITDSLAHSMADCDENYQQSVEAYLKAKALADEWLGIKEAFQQKSSMLKNLVDLYVTQYYGDFTIKGGAQIENSNYKEIREKMRTL